MTAALLSASRYLRRQAFDRLAHDEASAYVARDVLAFDEDAAVRARAAFFLGRAPATIASPALRDATYDAMPLVRHAAARAIAMARDESGFERLRRLAQEDPAWWVRRAAIGAATSLVGARAVPMLRLALEDPFWRVRHAAVRALLSLGAADGEALLASVEPATSERSAGALAYLRKRLGAEGASLVNPTDVPNAIVASLDPDPAVVTARVESGEAVTPAFLVECLGDPHEALRVTARKRLERWPDARALELALLWLEDARIPNAAETVLRLLDGLDEEHAAPLLDHALSSGAVGASTWALSYVAIAEDSSRSHHALRLARSEHVEIRRAAVAALSAMTDARATSALEEALTDPDDDVVRIAAHALLDRRETAALASLPIEAPDALLRRVLVAAADADGDLARLLRATRDTDPSARAAAVHALFRRGALDTPACARFAADPDPWVRRAVLDRDRAAHALLHDVHPRLRREAFPLVPDRRAAGVCASGSDDPWLRTRASATLDPRRDEDLAALLRLSRDTSHPVRAAAFEALQRAPEIDVLLDRALARDLTDDVRIAALAHRSRAFDAETFASLRARRGTEVAAVRAWIDDVLGEPTRPLARVAPRVSSAVVATRPLGRTGIEISPLAISGVGDLDPGAYADAMRAGCNLFFWEPRYHALGRALRKNPDAQVIAGSYHASERAIVSDVERSCRRLGRDALDVFLLFWVRSPARVSEASFEVLSRLKARGLVKAIGFSTHDRAIACDALEARAWDVVMTRHSAAHPGAESRLLPLAAERGVGVLGFSATSYGRVLSESVSAPDAYRYSLSQPAVAACVSAPRNERQLSENLTVLSDATMSAARQEELRAWGRAVREESRDFNHTIRRHPIKLADATPDAAEPWLDGGEGLLEPRLG